MINDNTPLEQKTKMNIIELEGNNIMNILARSVLEMYRFDPQADDTSRDNLMRQSIDLISKFPTIIAYAYNMLRHATYGRSLHIRHPREKLSIAENFLYMLKKDYTELDARTLDLLLVLQAEHGGGNNSTFTDPCSFRPAVRILIGHRRRYRLVERSASWRGKYPGGGYVPSFAGKYQGLDQCGRN